MNRTPSFSQRLKAGATKEDLMKQYALSESQYQKLIACVERIKQEDIKKRR